MKSPKNQPETGDRTTWNSGKLFSMPIYCANLRFCTICGLIAICARLRPFWSVFVRRGAIAITDRRLEVRTVPFYRPQELKEACQLLSQTEGAACLAGGTDLVVQMRDGRARPAALVDLSALDLGDMKETDDGWTFGALTTMSEVQCHVSGHAAEHSEKVYPELLLLAAAAAKLGAHQIQNRATLGGNICNASPAADAVCALTALDAKVQLESVGGTRVLKLAEFITGPGTTQKKPSELLTAVHIPRHPAKTGQTVHWDYLKMGGRTSLVCAIATLAGFAVLENGRFAYLSVALGSVGPTCILAKECAELMVGHAPAPKRIAEAAARIRNTVHPIDDVRASGAYRLDVVEALLTEYLIGCVETSKHGEGAK
jgi:CO/xanthine dehydrogenase FAD-binding subunit